MNKRQALRQMRNELAALYPLEDDQMRVAEDAELDLGFIRFSQKPVNVWGHILREADDSGKMEALVAVVEGEYPLPPRLQEALADYRQVVEAGTPDPDPNKFLDRKRELGVCETWLKHPSRGILLVRGEPEEGKTWLLDRLREKCATRYPVSALVDFGASVADITEPEHVIEELEGQIGSRFYTQRHEAEAQVEPGSAAGHAGPALGGPVSPSASQSVSMGETLVDEPQNLLRDSPPPPEPGAGPAKAQEKASGQAEAAWRAAVRDLQAGQPVLLAFDHLEEATEDIRGWLNANLFSLYRKEAGGLSNLWCIVVGQGNPIQEVRDRIHPTDDVRIGPLPDEDILGFWVDDVGLEDDMVRLLLRMREVKEESTGELCTNLKIALQE